MSFTKTLVHHHVAPTTTTLISSPTARFLLPAEDEDLGLVMRLDRKLERKLDTQLRRSPGSTPVPAKLCGQTKAVATWALFTWTHQIQKVSSGIQGFLVRLLPVFLYASLLVSFVQAGLIIYLLASAALPLGAWFLLACLAVMSYFYVDTFVQPKSSSQGSMTCSARRLSHSSSSGSLSSYSYDDKTL